MKNDFEQISLEPRSDKWQIPWDSLYGAAIGDICGSIYEFRNRKTDKPEEINLINDACFFTDDTVLTAAIAECVIKTPWHVYRHFIGRAYGWQYAAKEYGNHLWKWGNLFPGRGYGIRFLQWLQDKRQRPYNSFGNGAAMRISPVAWYFCYYLHRWLLRDQDFPLEDHEMGSPLRLKGLMWEVKRATVTTHGHIEGIKGAQSTALAILLAWLGWSKEDIRQKLFELYADYFTYDIRQSLADIRADYRFNETCKGTVPVALMSFLESHDFVSAIQNAISVGGDSDTIAAITGSIAEAYYREIPESLRMFAIEKLAEAKNIVSALRLIPEKSSWE